MKNDWSRLRFYYDPIFLTHLEGLQHPENPARLEIIVQHLKDAGIWPHLDVRQAPAAEEKWILTNHEKGYYDRLKAASEKAPALLDGGDTILTANSFEAAARGAGCALAAVDAIQAGDIDSAFCAVRPPGHHAEFDEAMGFCLFNNVAVAARYAYQAHELERVFIFDWDVHHGNGTQHSFYHSSDVYFASIHQSPHYPGTGLAGERGSGAGEGYTLNFPLPAGADDNVYFMILDEHIVPAIREYEPQLLIISAGFDAHEDDPLGGMRLSSEAFAEMTRRLKSAMQPLNGGKILSVLEGGYHHDNLAHSVAAHLRALTEPIAP